MWHEALVGRGGAEATSRSAGRRGRLVRAFVYVFLYVCIDMCVCVCVCVYTYVYVCVGVARVACMWKVHARQLTHACPHAHLL